MCTYHAHGTFCVHACAKCEARIARRSAILRDQAMRAHARTMRTPPSGR